ncbi:hypothetical protein HPB47_001298 [Ixodes persulcatus]|uniref:Uncharacterized protein n=1 Tax=Ixodes persulcatus TaxID=34615 RepID=A0AC60PPE2_IXOPE|nr:hypothetical protein HPB47_001298 [Ixodes persulcatus]
MSRAAARASYYQRHPGVVASTLLHDDIGAHTRDIRDIIRDVVREELRKLLPAAERPASLSVAEIVRDELPDKEPAPEKNQVNFPELDRHSRRSKRGSSTGRSRSRSTSGSRPGRSRSNSRSRSRSRGRVRDPSPDRNVTWAETASGKKSKSQLTETSELEDIRRTVKDKDRAIDRLLRKMDEDKRRHEETEKHLMKRIDDLMKGLKDIPLQQQDVTRTPDPSDQPSPTAEPAPTRMPSFRNSSKETTSNSRNSLTGSSLYSTSG